MPDLRKALQDHFSESIRAAEPASPFTARLIECLAADVDADGPVAALVADWPRSPRADALAMRLCGALHAAALSARDPNLAAAYPARNPDWDMNIVWPIARDFLARETAWVRDFIRSPPQTNEARRSIALLAGFLHIATEHPGPIDTLEIGASAGLNLHGDRFRYRTASWSWGAAESSVLIESQWTGPPPPLSAAIQIRSRAACDLNPLDITDPAQRTQLRSYIWPDQRERLARFDAAVEFAIAQGVRVERANALDWLRVKLAATEIATVVYHSVFWQYVPRDTREAIRGTIQAAGERATREAPVVWLRLEPESLLTGPADSARFLLDVTVWPGERRRVLAITDGHVHAVDAVAE
jgi:hypothetical protein